MRRPRELYKIISFPHSDTKNGELFMFQKTIDKNGIPFTIKKVLVIRDMKKGDIRGGHTHHKTHQIIIPITGGCSVNLFDGKRKKRIVLQKPHKGLLLYPYVWHTMQDFLPNTILLVIADRTYDEREYIRDYQKFLSYVRIKK